MEKVDNYTYIDNIIMMNNKPKIKYPKKNYYEKKTKKSTMSKCNIVIKLKVGKKK